MLQFIEAMKAETEEITNHVIRNINLEISKLTEDEEGADTSKGDSLDTVI